MNGSRLARLILPGLVAFLGIAAGAVVLILFWAPTISSVRRVRARPDAAVRGRAAASIKALL